jgi:hypothetical protein
MKQGKWYFALLMLLSVFICPDAPIFTAYREDIIAIDASES